MWRFRKQCSENGELQIAAKRGDACPGEGRCPFGRCRRSDAGDDCGRCRLVPAMGIACGAISGVSAWKGPWLGLVRGPGTRHCRKGGIDPEG